MTTRPIGPPPLCATEAQRHQLPFVVPSDQGIIDLMRGVAWPAILGGDPERFHQVPAEEVGDPDVVDLARTHQHVEGVPRRDAFVTRRMVARFNCAT